MRIATLLGITVVSFMVHAAQANEHELIPENYKLAYFQDFEGPQPLDDFVFTDPGAWQLAEKNGNHSLELTAASEYKPPHRSPRNIALLGDRRLGSFVLEADLMQTGKDYGHRDLCLFFGFEDPAHYYYSHIATQTDPHAHNIFIVNEKPRTKISETTTEGHDWGENKWHRIRLVRDLETGTIELYVNDMSEPIMTATDVNHGWGYVGFGSFDDVGRMYNLRIWAPRAEKKPAEFFEGK